MERATKVLGDKGEEIVAKFLTDKNFKILSKNFNTKYGEIDIIAQKDDLIVFVEVKTRKKEYFPISNVVTFSKQKKITKTAKFFLFQNNIIDKVCRFDVATVLFNDTKKSLKYIPNAFYAK